ncbi:TetR/AcrR family transcriptional regulator [Pacificispira sp.]|uniref:TetR/AcrR family transcriptional regulator n=1 Tax=Pacificispira sp. TaxID=2888761 RepID=UPI003B52137B
MTQTNTKQLRFPGIIPPKALLSAEDEERLSDRQREILVELEKLLMTRTVSDLTMANVAALLNCSMRSLYNLAQSKDELFLLVADRKLRQVGRQAMQQIDGTLPPMTALRLYLESTNKAVQPDSLVLRRNLASLAGGRELGESHRNFIIQITTKLLDRALENGDIKRVDTHATAMVLGGLGRMFSQAEIAETLEASPQETARQMIDIILDGLRPN